MKFTINRSVLNKSISDVRLGISNQTTIPILTGIKIEAQDDYLILTGSDADLSIETFIDAKDADNGLKIERTGGAVIQPASFLSDIIKKLPDEEVTIEVLDNLQVAIETATSSFNIHALDANQYPHLPEIQEEMGIQLPVKLFDDVIQQTIISVSNHESRPILTGVQFKFEDQRLTAVSTDSHRLSRREIQLDQPVQETHEVVIPGKSLQKLSSLLDGSFESIQVYLSGNQAMFRLPNTNYYTRLLEGNYPATDQLIPTETETKLKVNAAAFAGAVDRASLLSHAGKNNVIKLTIEGPLVEISGEYPEVGKIQEEIPYEDKTGADITISFNPDYMKQALRAFGTSDIQVEFVSSLRPFIIKPDDDRKDFIQLITPIRTPD